MRQERIEKGRRLIGISVREPGPAAPNIDPSFYHSLIANAADFVIMRLGVEVVFVPMERQDTQHCHAVMSKMLRPDKAWVLKEEYTSGQILSLIKHFEFVIGMRLHFLIFAALQDVPFVALPYSSKVSGFLEYLKIAMPPLNEINAGFTIAYIDKSWDERKLTKEKIQKLLPELKELARQNNKLAVELLTTKPTQNWHNHDEETKEQGA